MGEAAGLVFTAGGDESQRLAAAVRASGWPGIEDLVPAAESLGIFVDLDTTSLAKVLELAAGLQVADTRSGEQGFDVHLGLHVPRRFDVDVCFDGLDLSAVASAAGLAVEDAIDVLESTTLKVGWLGFMPGFPYLLGLPEPLRSVPRLERPRPRVPAGAFALANGYAGIYPAASPGGWNVLGRTGLSMFDPELASPATFGPGDLVHIRSVGSLVPPVLPERAAIRAGGPRRVVVLEPGVVTLVEDRGRVGVAHLGVPRAGPADPLRHAIANIAVGNPDGAAAFEITAGGPALAFGCDAFVALVGDCPLLVDGRETPASTTQLVQRGQTVVIGAVRTGLRAYLGVGGGIEIPERLGSRSSDAVTGIWPGPLRSGDEVDLGRPGRARGRWFEPAREHPAILRLSRGPDGVEGEAFAALTGSRWEVSGESNRVGTRLRPLGSAARPWPETGQETGEADAETASTPPSSPSRAIVMGAVQLPPDGCPVVLGPDHGTIGGYPVVAVVTRPSLAAAGQLRPGDAVVFEESDGHLPDSVASLARRSITGWLAGALGG